MFNSTIIIFPGSITICWLNPPEIAGNCCPPHQQVTAGFGQGQLKDQIIVEAWRHIVLPWKMATKFLAIPWSWLMVDIPPW